MRPSTVKLPSAPETLPSSLDACPGAPPHLPVSYPAWPCAHSPRAHASPTPDLLGGALPPILAHEPVYAGRPRRCDNSGGLKRETERVQGEGTQKGAREVS